ncbi:MAG: hypothetical protein ACO3AY_06840 [Chitinophagaceae bacterium]
MKKTAKFTITTSWILFSRSYDAYCTYQLTPNLSKEANPLVSVLGMGWTPLLFVISLLTLYTIYAYYKASFKPISLLSTEKGYSFSNIIAYTYLGVKEEWPAVFYKIPSSLRRFNQYVGNVFTPCLVFAGIISTVMWLLINYSTFYKQMHDYRGVYLILITGCFLINYMWMRRQYFMYLRAQC